MDISEIGQLISRFGFPIVMCGAMSWYVKYTTDKNREQITQLESDHKEEMRSIANALENNTIALQKLSDTLANK